MGGRAHGKVASETATSVIYRELAHILVMRRRLEQPYLLDSIDKAIAKANEKIASLVSLKPDADGMGTTVAVALLLRDSIYVGHVGDSRVYLLNGNEHSLTSLTQDHSVVQDEVRAGRLTQEEARRSKYRNMITRAVGVAEEVDPDISSFQLQPETVSYIVISSDGMHGSVPENQIASILRQYPDNPQLAAEILVDTARDNGARDNISAIVASIDTRFDDGIELAADGSILPQAISHEHSSYAKPRKMAWLTRANVLAFGIGMLIMSAIAWRFFPPELAPKSSFLPIPSPTLFTTPAPIPATNNLAQVDYSSPVIILKQSIEPNMLLLGANDTVIVMDITSEQLIQVDESSGKVVKTSPSNTLPANIKSDTGVQEDSDIEGNLYLLSNSPPEIMKLDSDLKLIRTIGEGSLTHPTAIKVMQNGNIFVIDSGKLKVFRVK
jgi:protein phosphatase